MIWYAFYLYAAPIQISIAIILLFREIQWSVSVGVLVLILLVLLQALLGYIVSKLKAKSLAITDERVSITSQIILGIRVLKLFTWEYLFENKIYEVRKNELREVFKINIVACLNYAFLNLGPIMVTFTVFSCYSLFTSTPLSVSTAFTSIALFNLLRAPLFLLPDCVNYIVNAIVSFDRLLEFLLAEECRVLFFFS